MSSYITLTLSNNTFMEIIDNLENYTTHLNDYWDIQSNVHLIDYLEEEKESYEVGKNKILRQEMENTKEVDMIFKEYVGKKKTLTGVENLTGAAKSRLYYFLVSHFHLFIDFLIEEILDFSVLYLSKFNDELGLQEETGVNVDVDYDRDRFEWFLLRLLKDKESDTLD